MAIILYCPCFVDFSSRLMVDAGQFRQRLPVPRPCGRLEPVAGIIQNCSHHVEKSSFLITSFFDNGHPTPLTPYKSRTSRSQSGLARVLPLPRATFSTKSAAINDTMPFELARHRQLRANSVWLCHGTGPNQNHVRIRHLKDLSALAESAGNYKVILDGSWPPAVPRMNDGLENFEVSFWHIF